MGRTFNNILSFLVYIMVNAACIYWLFYKFRDNRLCTIGDIHGSGFLEMVSG